MACCDLFDNNGARKSSDHSYGRELDSKAKVDGSVSASKNKKVKTTIEIVKKPTNSDETEIIIVS